MAHCIHCGKELDSHDQFCPSCGRPQWGADASDPGEAGADPRADGFFDGESAADGADLDPTTLIPTGEAGDDGSDADVTRMIPRAGEAGGDDGSDADVTRVIPTAAGAKGDDGFDADVTRVIPAAGFGGDESDADVTRVIPAGDGARVDESDADVTRVIPLGDRSGADGFDRSGPYGDEADATAVLEPFDGFIADEPEDEEPEVERTLEMPASVGSVIGGWAPGHSDTLPPTHPLGDTSPAGGTSPGEAGQTGAQPAPGADEAVFGGAAASYEPGSGDDFDDGADEVSDFWTSEDDYVPEVEAPEAPSGDGGGSGSEPSEEDSQGEEPGESDDTPPQRKKRRLSNAAIYIIVAVVTAGVVGFGVFGWYYFNMMRLENAAAAAAAAVDASDDVEDAIPLDEEDDAEAEEDAELPEGDEGATAVSPATFPEPTASFQGATGDTSTTESPITSSGTASSGSTGTSSGSTGSTGSQSSDYVLPEASTRAYSREELEALDSRTLWYARNELYARHGKGFRTPELQAYFDSKPWYREQYDADTFDTLPNQLNDYEQANYELMTQIEQERNSPYLN